MSRKLTALLLLLVVAGCRDGSGDDEEARIPGRTLTVYASLPRHGDTAREADAVAAGQRLALADSDGRAGGFRVRLVELDSSDADEDGWDPDEVVANAGRAADDPTTIAYLGELDFGGSAISVPITNEAGIAQVSPGDGLTSLTRVQPGGPRTTPERYYPRGRRTFLRLVPNDLRQAEALVAWIQERGARSVAIVHDDRLFGRSVAAQAAVVATRRRLTVTETREVRLSSDGYQDEADRLRERPPDAVLYAGRADELAGPLLDSIATALPGVELFAASGLANDAFAGGRTPPGVKVLEAARPRTQYPRAARAVLRRLAAERGDAVPVEALYGYESMRLVLDAIERAGEGAARRSAVVRAALAAGPRRGTIGRYEVGRTGEISERRFAGYRREDGRLVYDGIRLP